MAEGTNDTGNGTDRRVDTPPAVPRWVKSLALVVLAVLLIAVAVMVISGGEHSPSRHGSAPAPDGRPVAIIAP